MSNVSGSISVNVEFRDTTTSSGVQSLKTIALRDATEYTSGKVAIVTGTVGTTQVLIVPANLSYRNASGATVSMSSVTRFAFSVAGSHPATCSDATAAVLMSSGGRVSVSNSLNGVEDDFQIVAIGNSSGTAAYTLVLYGT
jgi:hypothetical protein